MHWWSLCVLVFPPFFDDDTNVNSTFMISKHTGGPGLNIFSLKFHLVGYHLSILLGRYLMVNEIEEN